MSWTFLIWLLLLKVIVIDQRIVFCDKIFEAKPIATKSRHSNTKDFEFMQNEYLDLLKNGIARCSVSPSRAEAFDVKGQIKRMVIEYSMTVIYLPVQLRIGFRIP